MSNFVQDTDAPNKSKKVKIIKSGKTGTVIGIDYFNNYNVIMDKGGKLMKFKEHEFEYVD